MGYKCSFLDNEIYGADDVSAAFSRLLSSGVLPYPQTETVTDALNYLTSEVVGSGVSEFGGLEVTRTETGAKVLQGAAVFESGVSVVVDSEGATVDFEDKTAVYIYFIYYPEFNSVLLKVSEEVPEGDTVVLAYIDATGKITDQRSYAKAKVAINTSNIYHDFSIHHSRYTRFYENATSDSQTVYTMPHNGFRYLLLKGADMEPTVYEPQEHILDLTNEGRQRIYLNNAPFLTMVYVEKNSTELTITTVTESTTSINYPHTLYFTLA
ncbi:MAG: hypothetical protein UIM24_05500 [Clostridia bacterium]|nr:hypothetical protein [Clostridia bacterium]